MSGYEFKEVLELRNNLLKFRKNVGRASGRAAEKIAQLAIRKVKQMTPVDNGDLRNNWKYHIIKKQESYSIVIYNQLEYAGWVEDGHRIVVEGVTVGWVEGRFMLQLTEKAMEKLMPKMWLREVEKEMRKLFGK